MKSIPATLSLFRLAKLVYTFKYNNCGHSLLIGKIFNLHI